MVDHPRPQLDFERRPQPIRALHYGIDLEIGIVTILEYLGVTVLGVDTQVANNQRLEQESEQVEVSQQAFGVRP